jgi:putative cell wall-binding protein
VLASGKNFPDGLAAATLAGALNAPVLLTDPDTLPAVTATEMKRLDDGVVGPATVYIVGGTAAISQAVRTAITSSGYTLNETGGADRYATAAAVATKAAGIATSTTWNGLRTAIVATGQDFPDALASGAVAFNYKMPILLTPTASLGSDASTALTNLGVQQAIIMGGTAAVATATETAIQAKGISTVRIAGTDRAATAAALATREVTATGSGGFGFAGTQVYLASGLNFPDALSSASLAGGAGAGGGNIAGPILLTASLPAATSSFLTTFNKVVAKITALGGTDAVAAADLAAAKTAATLTAPTATIVTAQGSRKITVTFSEAVTAASAQNTANYTLNNGALPGGTAAVLDSSGKVATITIPDASPALAAGDVIGVTAGVVTADARTVTPTTFTVPADVTRPTATIKAATNGTQTHAFIVFSEPITTDTAGNANAFDATDVSGSTSGVATSIFQWTPTTFQVNWGAPLTSGETITLNTSWKDLGGLTPAASTQVTVASDVAAPTLPTAKLTVVPAVQAKWTLDSGDLAVTALSSGAAAGATGNGWTVSEVDNNGALVVTVNSGTKTLSVASDLDNSNAQQTTDSAVAAALNADTTFKTLFVASVVNAGVFGSGTVAQTVTGLTTSAIAATFSDAIDPNSVTAADFNLDTNGDGVAEVIGASCACASVTLTNAVSANTVVVSFTVSNPALVGTVGSSKLQVVAAGVSDIAANFNPTLLATTLS